MGEEKPEERKVNEEDLIAYYSRKEVQQAIVESAKDREVGTRFLAGGFGKRPDVLLYPSDVLEQVKNGVSSFHLSEERWSNPLAIGNELKKDDIEKLRIGWDFIIDIDCPYWTVSRLTAWMIIQALKAHGISSISVKFSGNKGFHIGVPFEAFPRGVNGKYTATLFPEAPRVIAAYLLDYIRKPENGLITVENDKDVIFGNPEIGKYKVSLSTIIEKTGKSFEELTSRKGKSKGVKKAKTEKEERGIFLCSRCGNQAEDDPLKEYVKCKQCGQLMDNTSIQKGGAGDYAASEFNPLAIVEVDTILIASRHLFRSVYSMHEKSGLVSLPIMPQKLLDFRKVDAHPNMLKDFSLVFLDRKKAKKDEASTLIMKAYDHHSKIEADKARKEQVQSYYVEKKNQKGEVTEKIPVEYFPPCILHILRGLEDGKKRSVFILLNFLTQVGWNYDEIEALLREWNKKNKEPLREVAYLGQLRYHRANKKKVLPPNCAVKAYYQDIGICHPDGLCKKIKNPVNYAIVKRKIMAQGMRKARKRKEEKE